jgi:hypothetical protein
MHWLCIYTTVSCALFTCQRSDRLTTNTRTDIEQEVNGLYSFDRKEKIPAVEVKKVMDAAAQSYYDGLKE